MTGRYSQAMNIDVFLKGHAGDPIIIDRINRSSDYIRNPALTLVLTIQPDVLEGLMQNTTLRGRGMTARFLYSIPQSKVGARNVKSKSVPWQVKEFYSNNLKQMFRDIPENPILLTLSKEAYQHSIEFAEELEPRLIDDLENITDWASKLHGAILRIAAILHVAGSLVTFDTLVTGSTMLNSIKIGRYFLAHAQVAFALMGVNKEVQNCKYVLEKIHRKGAETLSRKDIQRLCRRKELEKIEGLEPVLNALCDHGYLKEYEQDRAGAVRKKDKYYKVNPIFLNSDPRDLRDPRDPRKEINAVSHVRLVSHGDRENKKIEESLKDADEKCPF